MDRQTIQDHRVIERYLTGRLTADEEQAFEEAYLADPEILNDLILTEKLQQGLRDFGALEPSINAPATGGTARPAWLSFLSSPRYAAAATVLLGLSLLLSTVVLVQNQDLRGGSALRADFRATRLLPLVQVRGNSPNVVEAPAADEWTVFLVDAGFDEYDEYRATLLRHGPDSSEQVWQRSDLSLTDDGRVAFDLPGRLLTPGEYEIELEGVRDAPTERVEQIGRTGVSVVRPDEALD